MKRAIMLGKVELEILQIVWEKGKVSSKDVWNTINESRDVAYTSVMTMMGILHKKGYLNYTKEGRTYIYSAAIDPNEVKHTLLQDTVKRVFNDSPVQLVQNLLDDEALDKDDIERIKKMIGDL